MKSKSMIMGSSRKIQYLESNFNIFYDDVLLNDVKYEKLLGITKWYHLHTNLTYYGLHKGVNHLYTKEKARVQVCFLVVFHI
jgi:hypothetical protein